MSNATTLTGPGPRLPTDFRQSLGSLDWEKLKPDVKLSLWHSYVAKQQSPPMSEADRIALELQAKYGDAISAEEKMSAQERLRFALASGTAKPSQAAIDPTPVPPGLVGNASWKPCIWPNSATMRCAACKAITLMIPPATAPSARSLTLT